MRSTWLLVVASGCGFVADATNEIIVAETTPIRVTVYKYGGDPTGSPIVEPNIRVDFIAPDATRQSVVTDAAGIAEASSPAGTTVIVYQIGEGGWPFFRSYEAVDPGDSIIVDRTPRQAFPPLGEITFVLPRRGPPGSGYELHVSCGGIGGSWPEPERTVSLASCPFATNATVVGWAHDANGVPITGPSVLDNVDLTALVGASIRMPAYEAKPSSVSGTFSGFPTSSFARWDTLYYNADDPAPLASATHWTPTLAGANTVPIVGVGNRTLSVLQFTPDGFGSVRMEDVADDRVSQLTVAGADMIRPIGAPTFDVATQTVSWPSAGYGQPATLVHVAFEASSFGIRRVFLDMYAPGDTSSLRLPPLPVEHQPQPTDRIYVSVEAMSLGGESYRDSMQLASTRWATGPNQWEPRFAGRIWRTRR